MHPPCPAGEGFILKPSFRFNIVGPHCSVGSNSTSSAIRDHSSAVVAASNLSGPDAVMNGPDAQATFLQALDQTQALISAQLGAPSVI